MTFSLTFNKLGSNCFGSLKRLRYILLCLSIALLSSCAQHVVHERPAFGEMSLDESIRLYRTISSIDTVMDIEYEKNETVLRGDGALSVSPDKLSLRIYYLGFLQGEVYEEKGEIRTKPRLDSNKSALLVQGLKGSLFWWNIDDYTRIDNGDTYELRNSVRRIVIDKNSLMPTEQTIKLENGDELLINYGQPARRLAEDGSAAADNSPLGWYPSRLRIQLRNYIVRIGVRSYNITK